jgi:hypothetical protein
MDRFQLFVALLANFDFPAITIQPVPLRGFARSGFRFGDNPSAKDAELTSIVLSAF